MEKKHRNILLVEDDGIIALNQKKQLQKHGYTIIHVLSGEKAIEAVKISEHKIDLILMDIDLGKGIDGTQAAKKILEFEEIPIVFLSSHTEPEVVEKTEVITSYGYVVKNSGITVLDASIKMAFKLFAAHKDILKHKSDAEKANTTLESTVDNLKIVNESLTRLDRAIENTNEIIFITNIDGLITYINPQFTKTYGYSEVETLGKICPRDLGTEKTTDEEEANFWKTLQNKHHIDTRYINKTRDGRIITVETSIDPIFDDKGNLKEFVLVQRDISEQIIAEEKILKSNNYLRFLNTIATEQANTNNIDDLIDLLIQQLKKISNAIFVTFSEYDSKNRLLKNLKISASQPVLNAGIQVVGKKILDTEVPVNDEYYQEIVTERIKSFPNLYEDTHGAIDPVISSLLQKTLKIDKLWGFSYVIDDKLYGASLFALKKGQKEPDKEVLDSFINISAISIRRHLLEKEQKERETKIRNIEKDYTHLLDKTKIIKAMLDNYEEAIWSVDKDFKYTFINSYFYKDFKEAFGRELKPGTHAFSHVRPELQKLWKPKYKAALEGERTSFEFEENAFRGKKYFRVNLNPIHINGKITGVSAISVDITKQKLTEHKLKKERQKSQQYLDTAAGTDARNTDGRRNSS